MISLFNQPSLFFSSLKEKLQQTLPGTVAQNLMTSRARISTEEYLAKNPNHRNSAVVLLLFPNNGTIYSMLIRRPSYDGMHSGQLALPGGKVDKEDTSVLHTALRETQEEVGVSLAEDQVLGKLTPLYIPVSNFLVNPFVAVLDKKPVWKPDTHEVEEILEFPLEFLFKPELKERRRIIIGKNMFIDAPCYIINGQVLWGATAMIFSELEMLLK